MLPFGGIRIEDDVVCTKAPQNMTRRRLRLARALSHETQAP